MKPASGLVINDLLWLGTVGQEYRNLMNSRKRLLSDFKLENKLWQFIKVNCNVIFKVKNWIYRCVGEMVKEDFITGAEAAK